MKGSTSLYRIFRRAERRRRVEVLMRGGLGNQLFCYAAGLQLALRSGLPLHLITRNYSASPLEKRSFELMEILPESVSFGHDSAVRKIWVESGFEYDPRFGTLSGAVLLDGYFQSPKYFHPIASTFAEQLRISLRRISGERPENFLGVHLRRGDYLNPEVRKIHGVVPLDYFSRGVLKLRQKLGNLPVLVFSDDAAAATALASEIDDAEVFDTMGLRTSIETLGVLSQSAGFCISNSTFSWWAAFISGNRPVIVPRPWFLDPSRNSYELYLDDWTVIDYQI